MFSPLHCDFRDPALAAAGAESYGILREICAGLDWDKAGEPDGALRTEMMIWSLVHGYAQLALAGLFVERVPGEPSLPVEAVVPAFRYRDAP
jgi:hypothetical protein